MKLLTLPIEKAHNSILAHSHKENGILLKKGTKLSRQNCENLKHAGIKKIIVAKLQKTDIDENKAATLIGKALSGGGLVAHPAKTGRVNLYASVNGLFCVNRKIINKINAINPAITLATLANDSIVKNKQLIATVKIIPFAVSKKLVERAIKIAKQKNIISIYSPKPQNVALVSTTLPILKKSIIEKTQNVLSTRLQFWQSKLIAKQNVKHEIDSLCQLLPKLIKKADCIILFGASAICDIDDIIPKAIKKCGGKIIYFGMPVDPGNLLLLAKLNNKFIIGAPGCARSKSHNGFDWILARILCKAPISPKYISQLGVGGLLLENKARGQPREN